MKVRWLRSASESLRRHKAYIAAENPAAAQRVGRQIRQSVLRLSEFPLSGQPGHVIGTRELVVPRMPYIVVYRVGESAIEILRVFHAASDWPAAFRSHRQE